MAAAVERVSSKRTIQLRSLGQVAPEFLRKEILAFTTQVALEENDQQQRLNPPNNPRRLVIDGRATEIDEDGLKGLPRTGNVIFAGMQRFVRIDYTQTLDMARAVEAAWSLLKRLVPKPTGRAYRSMYFYVRDFDNPSRSRVIKSSSPDSSFAAAIRWVGRTTSTNVSVHILGPTIEYRRTVIYRGAGRPKRDAEFGAGRADRLRLSGSGDSATARVRPGRAGRVRIQFQLQKAIHKIVSNRMNRQFRGIRFRYYFLRSRDLPLPVEDPKWRPKQQNVHIPVMIITPKKGRQR